jgi:hypothetical protein
VTENFHVSKILETSKGSQSIGWRMCNRHFLRGHVWPITRNLPVIRFLRGDGELSRQRQAVFRSSAGSLLRSSAKFEGEVDLPACAFRALETNSGEM